MELKKEGFTLIELLAAMAILGIIMAVAVPNVMGILRNSRDNTYVADAKKFISLAEYRFRAGNKIEKPNTNNMIAISLSYVDNSEFENAPNGGKYDKERSIVYITNEDGAYKYYVILVEKVNDSYRGVLKISYQDLYTKKPSTLVRNEREIPKISEMQIGSYYKIDSINSIVKRYQRGFFGVSSDSSDSSISGNKSGKIL